MNLLQTNTAINEGNSGGALFNMFGQVIGVTNMKMMSSYSSIEGIGFAIPSTTVRSVVNSLILYGEVRGRPAVGVTVGAIPENASQQYDLPGGLYVTEVSKGSDAEAKGIVPGDIITAVNGEPARTTEDIVRVKNALYVGDSITFTIWRNGETFDVEVVLVDFNDVY
jgi:serine protease Do